MDGFVKNIYLIMLLLIFPTIVWGQEIVAQGHFPDIAADKFGDLHLVYGRNDTLYYKKYDVSEKSWSHEISPLNVYIQAPNNFGIKRSDPDIVVDSAGNPFIFAGSDFVYLKNGKWVSKRPHERLIRDTEIAIDANDNIYLVHRGGNNGGYLGLLKFTPGIEEWQALTDPDFENLGRNDHVYADIATCPVTKSLYVIQRHAVPKKVTCNISKDGGQTWRHEGISDIEPESPHIVVDTNGNAYATLGDGTFYVRNNEHNWVSEGRVVTAEKREQPELSIDVNSNIFCGCWGGKYNIRVDGTWIGEKIFEPVTNRALLGYIEFVSSETSTYLVWEEGNEGTGDSGMTKDSVLLVAKINTEGSIQPLLKQQRKN